ncbi:MAG: Fur family transcriptional regulator [Patescibacteria group bacterium]
MISTTEILHSHNLKATDQRKRILNVLQRSSKPLCVHALVRKTKDLLDTATIYRTLKSLVQAGAVIEEMRGDEKTYHICSANHVHIICYKCHVIHESAAKISLPKSNKNFSSLQGHVTMQGLCIKCSK